MIKLKYLYVKKKKERKKGVVKINNEGATQGRTNINIEFSTSSVRILILLLANDEELIKYIA